VDVGANESMVAVMQIHDSRLHALSKERDQLGTRIVVRATIEARIIDAALIYAGAAADLAGVPTNGAIALDFNSLHQSQFTSS
jgi:hypothetical protein